MELSIYNFSFRTYGSFKPLHCQPVINIGKSKTVSTFPIPALPQSPLSSNAEGENVLTAMLA